MHSFPAIMHQTRIQRIHLTQCTLYSNTATSANLPTMRIKQSIRISVAHNTNIVNQHFIAWNTSNSGIDCHVKTKIEGYSEKNEQNRTESYQTTELDLHIVFQLNSQSFVGTRKWVKSNAIKTCPIRTRMFVTWRYCMQTKHQNNASKSNYRCMAKYGKHPTATVCAVCMYVCTLYTYINCKRKERSQCYELLLRRCDT